jgi:hypothetical protein
MADIYVINSLNYSKAVKFNIGLRRIIPKDRDGDFLWILEVGTTESGIDGRDHLAVKVNEINVDNVDDVLENAVSNLCNYIDWRPLLRDIKKPVVENVYPEGEDVSIASNVVIDMKDHLPSAGMDLSNMKVSINSGVFDFDITSEVEVSGDPYEYTLEWRPRIREYKRYEG